MKDEIPSTYLPIWVSKVIDSGHDVNVNVNVNDIATLDDNYLTYYAPLRLLH